MAAGAVIITALAISACGESGPALNGPAAESAFQSYMRAVNHARYAAACDSSTASARSGLIRDAEKVESSHQAQLTCTASLRLFALRDARNPGGNLKVTRVTFTDAKLTGRTAQLKYNINGNVGTGTATMQWTHQGWLMQTYDYQYWSAYASPWKG